MENKNVKAGVYCRTSTLDKGQDINLQLNELKQYAEARNWEILIYKDEGVSGTKDNRPALNQLMKDAKARKFSVVLCWKLDRLGRSLKHLLNTLDDFNSLGIAFVSLRDSIDMSTPSGKLMVSIIGAFAEFERGILVERVRAGMALAKLQGVQIGRRPTDTVFLAQIIEAHEKEKLSVRQISTKVKIPRSTVFRTLKQYKAGEIGRDGQIIKVA